MIKRLLIVIALLTWGFALYAVQGGASDVKQESEARWQKILTLKNSSQTNKLVQEAEVQMEVGRRY